jgi:hypothetical protein
LIGGSESTINGASFSINAGVRETVCEDGEISEGYREEGRQQSGPAERLVGESAIRQSVSQEHKERKIHQHTGIIIPNKTASWLFEVGPEAI